MENVPKPNKIFSLYQPHLLLMTMTCFYRSRTRETEINIFIDHYVFM